MKNLGLVGWTSASEGDSALAKSAAGFGNGFAGISSFGAYCGKTFGFNVELDAHKIHATNCSVAHVIEH